MLLKFIAKNVVERTFSQASFSSSRQRCCTDEELSSCRNTVSSDIFSGKTYDCFKPIWASELQFCLVLKFCKKTMPVIITNVIEPNATCPTSDCWLYLHWFGYSGFNVCSLCVYVSCKLRLFLQTETFTLGVCPFFIQNVQYKSSFYLCWSSFILLINQSA